MSDQSCAPQRGGFTLQFPIKGKAACVRIHPACERQAAVRLELIGELKQRCDSALFPVSSLAFKETSQKRR